MYSVFFAAFVAFSSSMAGVVVLATSVERLGQRFHSAAMGLCAGVMLGAAIFGLMIPGINSEVALGPLFCSIAVISGALLMEVVHQLVPHEHLGKGQEGPSAAGVKRSILIVAAIALHNFPEGFALGAGYVQPDPVAARSLLIGIAIQNLPEGLLVAIALLAVTKSKKVAFYGVLACSVVETLGTVFGGYLGLSLDKNLSFILLACAGAMIYVVSQEIIPESHRAGYETVATFSTIFGFVGMLALSMAEQM